MEIWCSLRMFESKLRSSAVLQNLQRSLFHVIPIGIPPTAAEKLREASTGFNGLRSTVSKLKISILLFSTNLWKSRVLCRTQRQAWLLCSFRVASWELWKVWTVGNVRIWTSVTLRRVAFRNVSRFVALRYMPLQPFTMHHLAGIACGGSHDKTKRGLYRHHP